LYLRNLEDFGQAKPNLSRCAERSGARALHKTNLCHCRNGQSDIEQAGFFLRGIREDFYAIPLGFRGEPQGFDT
jgi:hypothetical protein